MLTTSFSILDSLQTITVTNSYFFDYHFFSCFNWYNTSRWNIRRWSNCVAEVDVRVASCNSNHVFIVLVEARDINPSVPVVKCILPYRILQCPRFNFSISIKAKNGVYNYVLVSHSFLPATNNWITNCNILKVASIHEM